MVTLVNTRRNFGGSNHQGRNVPFITRGVLSESDAADHVRNLVDPEGIHTERVAHEELMLRNLAFYAGKQHFVQDGVRLREPVQVPKHRVLYKENHIVGAVNRASSMVATVNATFRAVPRSGSRRHRHQALVSERLFEHLREHLNYKRKKLYAYTWAANTGSSFIKTTYDPLAGDPERYYLGPDRKQALSNLSPEQKLELERQGYYQDHYRGEVRYDVVNGFQAYWDWDARDEGMEACDWFAQVAFIRREKAYDRFGERALQVSSGKERWSSYYYQEAIAFMSTGLGGLGIGMIGRGRDEKNDILRLVEYWERPNLRNNQLGRYIVMLGDQVVLSRDNPYRFARNKDLHLPFVKVDWWPMPGRFLGLSMTEQLTSPQFQLNKAMGTLIELQNIYGHPAMFVPNKSGIPTGMMSIEPGMVYGYNPMAGKPEAGPQPKLPAEIIANRNFLREAIQSISANSDPDSSKLPAQLRSGAALRHMMEEKNRVLAPTVLMSQDVDVKVGRNSLELCRHYYNGERVLQYMGEDGDVVSEYFNSVDVQNDLRITSEPDPTFSTAAARAEIMDLVDSKIWQLPQDVQAEILKAFHFRTANQFMRKRIRGALNQENEIEMMHADPTRWIEQPMPAMPYEDHASEIGALEDHFHSDEFKQADAMTKAVIYQHYEQHMAFQKKAMEDQMRMAQMMKGTPGQKGQASQPQRAA